MSKARNMAKRHQRKQSSQPPVDRQASEPTEPPQDAVRAETGDIEYTPMSGCLCRVFWLMLGNVFVALIAYAIAIDHEHLVGWKDVVYWLLVAALIASRYVDVRYLKGLTTEGERATMEHWRRYSLQLSLIAAGLWLGVHAIAFFAA